MCIKSESLERYVPSPLRLLTWPPKTFYSVPAVEKHAESMKKSKKKERDENIGLTHISRAFLVSDLRHFTSQLLQLVFHKLKGLDFVLCSSKVGLVKNGLNVH
jgi:hypothetical protein